MSDITIVKQNGAFWSIDIPQFFSPLQYRHLLEALENSFKKPGYITKDMAVPKFNVILVPIYELYGLINQTMTKDGKPKFEAQYSAKTLETYYPDNKLFEAMASIYNTLDRMRFMDEFGMKFWNGFIVF